jgi:hypothetical protein
MFEHFLAFSLQPSAFSLQPFLPLAHQVRKPALRKTNSTENSENPEAWFHFQKQEPEFNRSKRRKRRACAFPVAASRQSAADSLPLSFPLTTW